MDKISSALESSRIRNLPPYLFVHLNTKIAKARKEGRDIIDLGMGNPDMPAPRPVIEKLKEALEAPKVHRYSESRGIEPLRREVCNWYKKKYDVALDPEEEAIVCIGSKEGISHLALAMFEPDEPVLVPNPTYPSHFYATVIAGAQACDMPLLKENNFLPDLSQPLPDRRPAPRVMIVSYPSNPTAQTADLDFYREVVRYAQKNNLYVIHDLAYAEICFDGYRAPSFLQVPGAKEIGIEFYSLSKTYNMAGWRVGFAVGNKHIIRALMKLKSFYDYGTFTPIQMAAVTALQLEPKYAAETAALYEKRRDLLVKGLAEIGWPVQKPKATMYIWAEIPDRFKQMGSMDFAALLLDKADVAVSPGLAFGKYGEGFVRIAMVEDERRISRAVQSLKKIF